MPDKSNTRNTIIFVVLSLVLLGVYQFLVIAPRQQADQLAEAKRKAAAAVSAPAVQAGAAPGVPGAVPTSFVPRVAAVAASPRLPIKTPALSGSVALKGGRLDDLFLTGYRETVAKDSPPVELFRPIGAQFAYFAESGWTGANVPGLPGDDTVWTAPDGATLTPQTPVTLTYDNGQGLVFTRQIAVDDQFMFTITDTAANHSATPITLTPYSRIQRIGLAPTTQQSSNVFEGGVGVLGVDKSVKQGIAYRDWIKDWKKNGNAAVPSKGGWIGLTDKYWLAALIPDQKESLTTGFRYLDEGAGGFDAHLTTPAHPIAPGEQAVETTHIFAGAKTVPVLKAYEKSLGAPRLEDAVDWGKWFYWLTKPMFWLLQHIYGLVGNLGLALLGLTLVVRLVFFYPANISYGSMAKMKKVQPEIDALRVNFKDDPAGMQRETMALYAQHKINPLMGCLPMLATIPVLYSLYKVLNVAIEMRHAPFFGLLQDLSARDPTTIWNLFGLIPYHPATLPMIGTFLDTSAHLGIWAFLYGFTMFLSTSMSPPAGDPTQQQVMKWMPVIFTVFLSALPVGLLIYYTWSNLLTVLQQYVLMRKHKVDNPIDQGIARIRGLGGKPPG